MGECLGAISSPSRRSYGGEGRGQGQLQARCERREPLTRIAARSDLSRKNGARLKKKTHAAFGSAALVSANAQSIHCVSSATSEASTVAPHQIRRPAGASR